MENTHIVPNPQSVPLGGISGFSVQPHPRGEYVIVVSFVPTNDRFIPTCVGNTFLTLDYCIALIRFSPTCVGNTSQEQCHRRSFPVHPHPHGVCVSCAATLSATFSSSPPTWGILRLRYVRYIFCPVQPHSHGEYEYRPPNHALLIGSSPSAWGVRQKKREGQCANPVQPHSRGEYGVRSIIISAASRFSPACMRNTQLIQQLSFFRAGSAPPAWGILIHVLRKNPKFRFNPSCR